MTYVKKRTLCFCTLFIAFFMALTCGESLAEKSAEKANSKAKPPFTISKETTVITEPLRSDGYPDYVEALNRRFSKGVTPDNNSAVLFWKAVGPSEIRKEDREKYFQMLGIPPLSEKGDYLTGYEKYLTAEVERRMKEEKLEDISRKEELKKQLDDEYRSAIEHPWSRKDHPWLAKWLDANKKQLAMLIEASKRPRRYDSLIGKNASCFLLPGPQRSRDVARALTIRAMLATNEGKIAQAWQDIMACHRLARLVGQGPSFVEVLVSIVIETMALKADRALLEYGNLTPDQIAAMRSYLDQLPRISKMQEKMDLCERYVVLDCILAVAKNDPEGLSGVVEAENTDDDNKQQKTIIKLILELSDWDMILRLANSWCDRVVVVMKQTISAERQTSSTDIYNELDKLVKAAKDPQTLIIPMFGNPKKEISKRLGNMLVSLLLPPFRLASAAEDRCAIQTELTDLAYALAAYKADNGAYPAKLEELVPKYIKAIRTQAAIRDIDLRYTRENDGYLLSSASTDLN